MYILAIITFLSTEVDTEYLTRYDYFEECYEATLVVPVSMGSVPYCFELITIQEKRHVQIIL